MENIRKTLITFVFLSLLVDAAVSIPLAHRHNHSTGEYAPASAAAGSSLLWRWFFRGKWPPTVGKAPSTPSIKPLKIPKDVEKSFNEAESKFSEIGKTDLFKKVFNDLSMKHKKSLKHLSALDDCLLMTTDTIQLIQSSFETFGEFSISEDIHLRGVLLLQAHQLLSAAQTNVATCIDGFSHSRGDKTVLADLNRQHSDLDNLNSLVNNLMSIANNLSDEEAKTVKAPPPSGERWMTGEEYWPEWLSVDDRNLLEEKEVKGNFTVSKKGKEDFRTVSAAVAAAVHAKKGGYSKRIVIRIKEGKYIENVVIPKDMKNLTFVGDGKERTLIVAAKNVVDGNTTFNSATVGVAGDGFIARDITFQNSAGPSKLQAVALRVNADRAIFYNCSMIGYQNTLYVHSLRQFYKECYISGTVDFIFGNAAVVLHGCNIEALTPNPEQQNTVTAQGRNHPGQNTGIFILNSHITGKLDAEGNPTTYLGRPWGKYSRTVVVRTEILDGIYPAGWVAWNGQYALDTLFYAEYENRGPGAGKNRVEWGIQPLNEVWARQIVSEMGFN